MPHVVTVLESALLSLMLSATFWNAVSGHAPVGGSTVTVLVVATTAVLTAVFVLDEVRNRARVYRARNG